MIVYFQKLYVGTFKGIIAHPGFSNSDAWFGERQSRANRRESLDNCRCSKLFGD